MIQTHFESNILWKIYRLWCGAAVGVCVAMTQWLVLMVTCSSHAVAAGEPVVVFAEHPRLLLRPARLRLLQRERERSSVRWRQLADFIEGEAPLEEPGFAQALYYRVSGDAAVGRRAVAWALGPAPGSRADLRQLAFIFDWCQPLLSETQQRDLIARMRQRMMDTAGDDSIAAVRSRVLAAVALFDHLPQLPNEMLENVVHDWWGEKRAPALAAGRNLVPREDAYALWEILHVIRDGTNIDLREAAPRFFKEFPIEHLMSHYPATYPGEDNDFHIGASRGASINSGEPDLRQATLSRASELAMVAYDSNAQESQYLQGWLMHDNFMLRSAFGAPYEFLWANPYQPGLSYTLLPLIYHNADSGRLFVRSDWDDSSDWFGYFDGVGQVFRDGRVLALDVSGSGAPLMFQSALIYFGTGSQNFRVTLEDEQQAVIIAGLKPRRTYQIEIDDEELFEETTDPGGILLLDVPHGKQTGVRLREGRQ